MGSDAIQAEPAQHSEYAGQWVAVGHGHGDLGQDHPFGALGTGPIR